MNKSGFIMIEMLLSIIIFSTILLVLNTTIYAVQKESEINKNLEYDALLIKKIQEDSMLCQQIISDENFKCKLFNQNILEYKINQEDQLIRTIDNRGYEIIDPQITNIQIQKKNPLIIEIDKQRTYLIGVLNE